MYKNNSILKTSARSLAVSLSGGFFMRLKKMYEGLRTTVFLCNKSSYKVNKLFNFTQNLCNRDHGT